MDAQPFDCRRSRLAAPRPARRDRVRDRLESAPREAFPTSLRATRRLQQWQEFGLALRRPLKPGRALLGILRVAASARTGVLVRRGWMEGRRHVRQEVLLQSAFRCAGRRDCHGLRGHPLRQRGPASAWATLRPNSAPSTSFPHEPRVRRIAGGSWCGVISACSSILTPSRPPSRPI